MQTEIFIAGFGGQGVLFAGQLLAYAAMEDGKEVTWIPSYGPEMRGGTANCTVIIADEPIGSPFVCQPQALLAFNQPSLDKYEALVRPGGLLVVNSSLITRPVKRVDIRAVLVPASEIAESIGEKRMTNMVVVGALLANLPVVSVEAAVSALQQHLPARHQHLLPANIEAIQVGKAYVAVGV
jgi:2-oxoglutarate ferredoxin oxidoreductase subunit gamma